MVRLFRETGGVSAGYDFASGLPGDRRPDDMTAGIPILVLVIVILLALPGWVAAHRAFGRIRLRPCAGRLWLRAFPGRTTDVRRFLRLFDDAFMVGRRHFLKLRPDDALLDVYRAIYPPSPWCVSGDCCEFEVLERLLKREYGLALASIWRDDLTLRELFGVVSAR